MNRPELVPTPAPAIGVPRDPLVLAALKVMRPKQWTEWLVGRGAGLLGAVLRSPAFGARRARGHGVQPALVVGLYPQRLPRSQGRPEAPEEAAAPHRVWLAARRARAPVDGDHPPGRPRLRRPAPPRPNDRSNREQLAKRRVHARRIRK